MKFAGNAPEDMRTLSVRMQRFAAAPSFASINLEKQNAAPAKPAEGDVVYADGTNWNPGSGQGFYGYRGAAWHLLG